MKNCTECNYKFTLSDRLKGSFFSKLKCKNCNALYKEKNTIYSLIYYSSIVLIFFIVRGRVGLENPTLNFILYMIIAVPIVLLFNFIPHK
ncbi:TIGR04104 family putative zinc finger protein [Faecalimicrobium sp. JNUCC 81]